MSAGSVTVEIEAITRFEGFARVDPDNPLVWMSLGDLYHRVGRFHESLECYAKVLALEPGNLIAQSRLAGVMISLHDFAGAERQLESVLREGETDPALYHNLGLALYYQERWDEALEAFDAADASGLALPDNLAYRAYALHHQGNTEQALELARQWAAQAPGERAEGYLSLLEMDHGDIEAARRRASAVLEREPGNTDAAVVVGTWMIERQEAERGLELFRQVTEKEPDNPRGWLGLGLLQLYQQNFSLASQTLDRAKTLMPNNMGTLVTIGWAKLLNRDLVGAEHAFRHAVEVNRNFAEAHGGLASVLAMQGKEDESRAEIRRAMGLDKGGFGAVFAHSQLLERKGKHDAAVRLVSRSLQHTPREGGPSLIDSIQVFARREAARGATTLKPPSPVGTPSHDEQLDG